MSGAAGMVSANAKTRVIVVDDSGIEAGALQPMGLEKFQRAQQLSLENGLPFVHLVESAGANLLRYRVEDFIFGGSHYARLARMSAAGIPVLTIVHGSATAGGAYMPGMSDFVVMVRDRARAFLARLMDESRRELPRDILMVNVTTVIGAHVGPNGLGFASVRAK